MKDKDQIERLYINTRSGLTASLLKELFRCIPANLTHFYVSLHAAESLVREDLTTIIENNESLLKCQVLGKKFCWKLEEITDRNNRAKNAKRFKVVKVAAPQDPETKLGKRGGFVCDASDCNPNKKSKHN